MIAYPEIDPVALSLGPLKVHWYGLMYLFGIGEAWWFARLRARQAHFDWSEQQISDLIFYGAMGVVLGGRIGYVLFYAFERFIHDPVYLFRVWDGGMSFHGGLLGVMLVMWLTGRRRGKGFFEVADFVAPFIPLGLGFGRIGNFINGELWGKESTVPWAMQLQPGGPAYHPSQLYQAFLEGVVLFAALWIYGHKPRPAMAVSGAFLVGYGIQRFLVEFVRTPDEHIGYLAFNWVTMGQVLSIPMILAGGLMIAWAYHNNPLELAIPDSENKKQNR